MPEVIRPGHKVLRSKDYEHYLSNRFSRKPAIGRVKGRRDHIAYVEWETGDHVGETSAVFIDRIERVPYGF